MVGEQTPERQRPFHEQLLDCARRIAVRDGQTVLDLAALWKSFLYLAEHGAEQARDGLQARWPGRDWREVVPDALPDVEPGDFKLADDLNRLLGPLGVLRKKFGGRFTEANFLPALNCIGAWSKLGMSSELPPEPTRPEALPTLDAPPVSRETGSPDPPNDVTAHGGAAVAPTETPPTLADALNELRSQLEAEVYGQAAAVRAFADGMRAALDRPVHPGRLAGSFLVFGPNGCGKGEMIRVLEDWTRKHRSILRTKRVVRCEGYLPNALPTLYQDIRAGEPGFLVFGEFEKYGEAIREVLMDGLDRAVLQLPKGGRLERLEATPIHGWIVILIGNVGRAMWGRLPFKEQHLLPDREYIRNALEHEAIADEHHRNSPFAKSLSRSFLDRLDFFIPFCQLRYADVERVLRREITQLANDVASRGAHLDVHPRVVELVLLGAYYKRTWSARQSLRGFKQHMEAPVYHALMQEACGDIRLTCLDKRFNATLQRSRPRILLLDDEWEQIVPLIRDGLEDKAEVCGAKEIGAALDCASEQPPDLLLLDMFFGPENQCLWKDYLETWRSTFPDCPVLVLSGKRVDCSDRLDIDKSGGVLGFVAKAFEAQAMGTSLLPFLEHAAWQARVRAFERAYGYGGDRIVFDVGMEKTGADVDIRFSGVSLVVNDGRADRAPDPILAEEPRREIEEFVDLFLDSRKRTTFRIKQPRGLLLHGPAGNGKTMVARSLARRMRCNFLAMAASDFQGRYAGMRAERIKEVFEQARMRQPCVVFIDEIDGVAPHRTEDSGGGLLRDQADAVAVLLTELDGFNDGSEVFLIGATNRKDSLDAALLRPGRIDRIIEIDKPGIRERIALLTRFLEHIPGAGIDVEWAARECFGFSCADIEKVVGEAQLLALRRLHEGEDVAGATAPTTADFREAADRIRYGLPGREHGEDAHRAQQRETTAWHEAGHLVLTMALLGEVPDRVTIVPRGDFGGFVRFSEEDIRMRANRDRRSGCLNELAVMLAGGAAEALKFGEHGMGVSRDREQAHALAHAMIVHWGMGPPEAEAEGYLGSLATKGAPGLSMKIAPGSNTHLIPAMVAILKEATELSNKMVQEHRIAIDKAASLLLEKEEITRDDLFAAFPEWAKKREQGGAVTG